VKNSGGRNETSERKLEQPPENSNRQTKVESPRYCPSRQRCNGQKVSTFPVKEMLLFDME
jgi:hypothetical protein